MNPPPINQGGLGRKYKWPLKRGPPCNIPMNARDLERPPCVDSTETPPHQKKHKKKKQRQRQRDSKTQLQADLLTSHLGVDWSQRRRSFHLWVRVKVRSSSWRLAPRQVSTARAVQRFFDAGRSSGSEFSRNSRSHCTESGEGPQFRFQEVAAACGLNQDSDTRTSGTGCMGVSARGYFFQANMEAPRTRLEDWVPFRGLRGASMLV